MNNLLQFLRGVLSALIGFQSPEDGLLEKARRRWNEGRTNRPSLLDEAWEERVMFTVRLSPMDDPDVPDWLAQRFRPLALANAVIILCALMLFWHAGDPGTALAEYAQSALAGYEAASGPRPGGRTPDGSAGAYSGAAGTGPGSLYPPSP